MADSSEPPVKKAKESTYRWVKVKGGGPIRVETTDVDIVFAFLKKVKEECPTDLHRVDVHHLSLYQSEAAHGNVVAERGVDTWSFAPDISEEDHTALVRLGRQLNM